MKSATQFPPTTGASSALVVGGVHCNTTITLAQSVAVPVTRIVLGTGIPIPTTSVMVTLQVIKYFPAAAAHRLSAVVA
jgi:hypothetical protein